jgi:hypothetical protein
VNPTVLEPKRYRIDIYLIVIDLYFCSSWILYVFEQLAFKNETKISAGALSESVKDEMENGMSHGQELLENEFMTIILLLVTQYQWFSF